MTPNSVVTKSWGSTQLVFEFNGVEMHRIKVEMGGFCSVHRHLHKNNLFMMERGSLSLVTGRMVGGEFVPSQQVEMCEGERTVVPVGIWHQFRSSAGATALEVYWVDARGEDIDRHSVGGICA